jgi:hypothetical protein
MNTGYLRILFLALLVGMPACSGSESDTGTIIISADFDMPPESTVYVWARVEERADPMTAGTFLAMTGPISYEYGEGLYFELEVPAGDNRHVVIEVREGANLNLPIMYYGISDGLSVKAGKTTKFDMPLMLEVPEASTPSAMVELIFDGEVKNLVNLQNISQATIKTTSSNAVSVLIANDASFIANVSEFNLDSGEGIECIQEDEGYGTWDVCEISAWDMTAGLGDYLEDSMYTVFLRFIDKYGYSSQVYRTSVILDSIGPQVLMASLTPPVAGSGNLVFLNVLFHEPLADHPGAAVLEVFPESPSGAIISGPMQVGTSTSYLWTLDFSSVSDYPSDVYTFAVTATDTVGNMTDSQFLIDADGQEQALYVDPIPPLLVGGGSGLDKTLFGLNDAGVVLSFDFVIEETSPHMVDAGPDGECVGLCPSVRIGGELLGVVYRIPELDDGMQGYLGFRYEYTVDPADWGTIDQQLPLVIQWSDLAGNTMKTAYPDTPRFDFTRPSALMCSLMPQFGNTGSVFTYIVTVSEMLAEPPMLMVETVAEGLFAEAPEVIANGMSYLWTQPAVGIPSGEFTVSAILVDSAGNESAEPVCELMAQLDGEPPMVSNDTISTSPEVINGAGEVVLAAGDGYTLNVSFDVADNADLASPPDVRIAVPGMPISFQAISAENTGEGTTHYEYELVLSAMEHMAAEGLWPISVQLQDQGGNETVVNALGGTLVRIDFTSPVAECFLLPAFSGSPYSTGDELTLVVIPLEALANLPVLQQSCDPECPALFFEYLPDSQYQFSYVVAMGDGSYSFDVYVELTDLVGNTSSSACLNGPVSGLVDGTD